MKFNDLPYVTVQYFDTWYDRAKIYQENNGVKFELLKHEFYSVIEMHKNAVQRINSRYLKWINRGRTGSFNAGYVLTWKNRKAIMGKVMNKDTVVFANREVSKKNCRLQKGDKHTEVAKLKMSKAKLGKSFSDDHKKALSLAHIGNVQSEAEKAKRKATWAAKRLAKALSQSQ